MMSAVLRTALLLSAAATALAWWADEPTRTRSKEPPYPYPKDRKYNTGAPPAALVLVWPTFVPESTLLSYAGCVASR